MHAWTKILCFNNQKNCSLHCPRTIPCSVEYTLGAQSSRHRRYTFFDAEAESICTVKDALCALEKPDPRLEPWYGPRVKEGTKIIRAQIKK